MIKHQFVVGSIPDSKTPECRRPDTDRQHMALRTMKQVQLQRHSKSMDHPSLPETKNKTIKIILQLLRVQAETYTALSLATFWHSTTNV